MQAVTRQRDSGRAVFVEKTKPPDFTKIEIFPGLTRRSAYQIKVDLTAQEAMRTLIENGYAKTTSKDGTVFTFEKGDKLYTFYPRSTGGGVVGAESGAPSAALVIKGKNKGKPVVKIRFEGEL